MFDEADVAYPDDSWTWDDFEAAAAALTKDDGSQYGYAMQTTEGQQTFYNAIYSMGGAVVNEDKTASGYDMPESIEAVEFMSSLTINGYTPPYETLAENTADALFQSGTVAMVTMGSWMIPAMASNEYVVANCDIAVLPKDVDTGRRVSIYNGLGWAAAANTEYPEEAWALIEYMGTEAAQQKQSDLGIVMSAYDGTAANFINSNPNFNIQAYIDMMADMVIFPHTKSTVAWTNAIDPVYVEIWSGQTSAADGCVEMAEIMNGHISQE